MSDVVEDRALRYCEGSYVRGGRDEAIAVLAFMQACALIQGTEHVERDDELRRELGVDAFSIDRDKLALMISAHRHGSEVIWEEDARLAAAIIKALPELTKEEA